MLERGDKEGCRCRERGASVRLHPIPYNMPLHVAAEEAREPGADVL